MPGMNKGNSDFNSSYVGQRPDILKLIPLNAKRVLDIGCSTGNLGESIKDRTSAFVVGVEISPEMARVATKKIDKVIVGDIEKIKLKVGKFDVIVMADLLEHLQDPWNALNRVTNFLADNGIIVTSIPNIRHIHTIINLVLKGNWPYRDRGVHDRTHLRFFTKSGMEEIFSRAKLEIIKIEANYRFIDPPHIINQYAKFFAWPVLKDFLVYQYLIVACKK